jgi:hypothetical protein
MVRETSAAVSMARSALPGWNVGWGVSMLTCPCPRNAPVIGSMKNGLPPLAIRACARFEQRVQRPLAICDRRRFERRVAASAWEMRGCAVCSANPVVHLMEPSSQQGFYLTGNTETPMNTHRPKRSIRSKGTLPRPVVVAITVAAFGVTGMLIFDHGPWNRPAVQTAEIVNYTTTGAAARAVGATVTPTAPKLEVEPVAPGPKPAQPANPTPR